MPGNQDAGAAVRSGDAEGRGRIYDELGALTPHSGEVILDVAEGWDLNASSPWRRVLPGTIFVGFNSKAVSRLYVTSLRIVLIREIDSWREVAGDMTPLGIPTGIAKDARLRRLRAAGVRQYCEIYPSRLRIMRSKKSTKHGSWLGLYLVDEFGRQFALSFWKTDGKDDRMLSVIESRFAH